MSLTEEQKQRIAANKAEAMRRLTARNAGGAALPRPSLPVVCASRPSGTAAIRPNVTTLHAKTPGSGFGHGRSRASTSFASNFRQPFPNQVRSSVNQNRSFEQRGISTTISAFEPNRASMGFSVVLSVFDSEQFRLDTRSLIEPIKQFCQNFHSRRFDGKEKCWLFHWLYYEEVVQSLRAISSPKINVEEVPKSVVDYFRKKRKPVEPDPDKLRLLQMTFWTTLYDYQKEGVLRGIANSGRILIADEMGLGKSIQAIALTYYYKDEWPLLIACPSSVKGSWERQLEQFLPGQLNINTIDKGSDVWPNNRSTNTVVIVSYDMLTRKASFIEKERFYVVIFDESHLVKEPNAKRTKAALQVAKVASRVILLSGTPAISRPAELFCQIRMIEPKLFPNWKDFAMTYCDGKQTNWGFQAKGATRTTELNKILTLAIMIRRTKENIELPDKKHKIIYLSKTDVNTQMSSLREAKQKLEKARPKDYQENLVEYYRLTAVAKTKAVTSYLKKNYLDDGVPEKMLVFAHHQVMMDSVCSVLMANNIEFIRIDGKTLDRKMLVANFQNNDKVRIAVLSLTAAGVGITLTAASLVIFTELHWTPSAIVQAEDRAHRVGQTKTVNVHFLLAKDTADDALLNLLKAKMRTLDKVSLNTGDFNNMEKVEDDPSTYKITKFFEQLASDSQNPNFGPAPIKPGEVIDIDDDEETSLVPAEENVDDSFWSDDELFTTAENGAGSTKRALADGQHGMPAKRMK